MERRVAVGGPRAGALDRGGASAPVSYVRSKPVCQMFRPEPSQNGRTITMMTITTMSSVGASFASR